MRKEILDIRNVVTIILVTVSLVGHKWSISNMSKSDAQNLNFIHIDMKDKEVCLSSTITASLGWEHE
jgi:hypothetical protein